MISKKGLALNAHHTLGGPVAVRSSSPVEDLEKEDTILEAVKECWASLWSTRAVEYRKTHNITEPVEMAVLIQEMVPVTVSGVMFTSDTITIEAVWGSREEYILGKVHSNVWK